jgi:hypothetical protein
MPLHNPSLTRYPEYGLPVPLPADSVRILYLLLCL